MDDTSKDRKSIEETTENEADNPIVSPSEKENIENKLPKQTNSPLSTDKLSSAQSAPVTNPNLSKLTTNKYLYICTFFIFLLFAKTIFIVLNNDSDFFTIYRIRFQFFCGFITLMIGVWTIVQSFALEYAQKALNQISQKDLIKLQLSDSLIVSIGCASLTTCAFIEYFENFYLFLNSLEYFYLLYVPCLIVSLTKKYSFNKSYKSYKQTAISEQITATPVSNNNLPDLLKIINIIKWIIIVIVITLTIFGICYLIFLIIDWLNHPII